MAHFKLEINVITSTTIYVDDVSDRKEALTKYDDIQDVSKVREILNDSNILTGDLDAETIQIISCVEVDENGDENE